MLKRVLSAVVALPIFFYAVYYAPTCVFVIAIGLVSSMAAFELLHSTGFISDKKILILSCLVSFSVSPVMYFFSVRLLFAVVFLFICVLFFAAITNINGFTFEKVAGVFFAVSVIPCFFSSIMRIYLKEDGLFLIILPFIAAWMTDTFAFFFGYFFGRHKLAPLVSPKKTIEGSIGGIIGSVVSMAFYGYILSVFFNKTPDYLSLCFIGLLGSMAAQLGDLSMSFIKRNFKIKDYGTIMPGHGGVLDRFDSVLFASPLIEILLFALPRVIK